MLLIAKDFIVGAYSTHAGVAAMASGVLVWVAAYHAADALQTVCVFVLRCYGITLAPLAVYGTLLWGAGLGGGYLMAYQGVGPWGAMPSPSTFWAASAMALAVTAVLFTAMLRRALARSA